LSLLDSDNEKRRKIADKYLFGINNNQIVLPTCTAIEGHVWHCFTIRTENRYEFQKYLITNEVQSVIHYPIPPHKQKAYKEWENHSYPISEAIHNTIISLPVSPVMNDHEVATVIQVINSYNEF